MAISGTHRLPSRQHVDRGPRLGRPPKFLAVLVATIVASLHHAVPASAQTVDANPTSANLPGGAQIQELINWMAQYALWSGLAAIIFGAAWMGWSFFQGRGSGSRGQMLILGGGMGALVIAFAPDIINNLSS